MSGLFVIHTHTQQDGLCKRRFCYQEYALAHGFAYVRQEHNTDFLGVRQDDQMRILPQWMEDVRSASQDRSASFFFVDARHRESFEEAILRGMQLPVVKDHELRLRIDQERRLAVDCL